MPGNDVYVPTMKYHETMAYTKFPHLHYADVAWLISNHFIRIQVSFYHFTGGRDHEEGSLNLMETTGGEPEESQLRVTEMGAPVGYQTWRQRKAVK